MAFQTFTVAFDDGEPIEVRTTSRDLLKIETDGVILGELKPIEGTYTLAWYALARMKRQGKIDVDVPDSPAAFMDLADIDTIDDPDPEGKGSGREATPGGSAA